MAVGAIVMKRRASRALSDSVGIPRPELWALFLGGTILPRCAYFRALQYGLEAARGEMFDYSSRKFRLRKTSQIFRTSHDPRLV